MSSSKLGPSLVIWVDSLASSLPSLTAEEGASGASRRVVKTLADLNDGVVLGDVAGLV
jgi:protein HOOK3